MEIMSSFPHSQIIPNLFDFFSSERKKERKKERKIFFFPTQVTKLFGYQHSSKYFLCLCSAEEL